MPAQYLGTITKTHGINGECILSDVDYLPALQPGTRVQLGYSEAFAKPYTIESCREYKQGALLKIKGINTIDAAEALRELGVFVDRAQLTQNDTEQFSDALSNYEVLDAESKEHLGTVSDVWAGPAHRTIVVSTGEDNEVLVPFVLAIVKTVDHAAKQVLLSPPEGLFNLDALPDVDHEEFDGDEDGEDMDVESTNNEFDADVDNEFDDEEMHES